MYRIFVNKSETDLVQRIHLISISKLKIVPTLHKFLKINQKVLRKFNNPNLKLESQNFLDPVLAKPESKYKARF